MTVKLTGTEFEAFMNDKEFWWDGRWYEDAVVSINGAEFFDWDGEQVQPEDEVRLQGGMVYDGPDVGATFYDLEKELRKWLKARSVSVIVLEVDSELAETLRRKLAEYTGVKVIR